MTHFKSTFLTIFTILSFFLGFQLVASQAFAIDFNNGTYINLCGSGTTADNHTCRQGCNTSTGICSATGNVVVKFTCDGRVTDCRQNESSFASSQSIGSVSCGKTVQIDVFNKDCRSQGGWGCGDQDLKDYMVWYSGDCQAQPTPQTSVINRFLPFLKPEASPTPNPTPTLSTTPAPSPSPLDPHESRCEELDVVSGNNSLVPAKVTLRARGYDNRGGIQRYKFYFGDGTQQESNNPEIQHTYESSGTFLARVDIKDSQGFWETSLGCETRVWVEASPVESHKSGCSDIKITASNSSKAPAEVEMRISGYDNKGEIQEYRIESDGTRLDRINNTITHTFPTAGTYIVRGYIKDSQGNWVGGEDGCRRTVYINTETLTVQPATGTPTLFSIFGVTSGLGGAGLFFLKKKLQA